MNEDAEVEVEVGRDEEEDALKRGTLRRHLGRRHLKWG